MVLTFDESIVIENLAKVGMVCLNAIQSHVAQGITELFTHCFTIIFMSNHLGDHWIIKSRDLAALIQPGFHSNI